MSALPVAIAKEFVEIFVSKPHPQALAVRSVLTPRFGRKANVDVLRRV